MIIQTRLGLFEFIDPKPPDVKPTQTIPGTAERLDVMRERLLAGAPLHKADDRTLDDVVAIPESHRGHSTAEPRERFRHKVNLIGRKMPTNKP